jgi:endonuclease III
MQKDYGATYRSVEEALKPELPSSAERLKEAHLLLRMHGKTLCKDKTPQCHECPVSAGCNYAESMAASFLRNEI